MHPMRSCSGRLSSPRPGSGARANQRLREVSIVKKMVFIVAWLEEDPEAYEGITNADVEKGLMEDAQDLPYVAKVEKVTVLDMEE